MPSSNGRTGGLVGVSGGVEMGSSLLKQDHQQLCVYHTMAHLSVPNLVDIGSESSYTDDRMNASVHEQSSVIMRTPQYKASVFQVVTSDYPVEIAALFVLVLPIVYFLALINPNETRRLHPGEEILFFKLAFFIIVIAPVLHVGEEIVV